MKNHCWLIAVAACILCAPAEAGPIKVVASFSILGDIVRQIAGDHAEVTVLVGPDGDVHTFDPSPADARKLNDAALVVTNGLGLDAWIDKLAASAGYAVPRLVASNGVKARTMIEAEGGQTKEVTDPHAWQDPRNGIIYALNIADGLAKADPVNASEYQRHVEAYAITLGTLDAYIRKTIGAIAKDKRRVITSHDAFGYFGAAYDVEFLAPEGLSTDQEASAGSVAKLIDQIRKEKVKAIFMENMTDPRLIQMIAAETGATLGGALYSDALSPADGPASCYLCMFQNNVPKLVAGMKAN